MILLFQIEISPIGIFAPNRLEWVLVEQGCNSQGYCTVPVYATLGLEAVHHIVTQTELTTVSGSDITCLFRF